MIILLKTLSKSFRVPIISITPSYTLHGFMTKTKVHLVGESHCIYPRKITISLDIQSNTTNNLTFFESSVPKPPSTTLLSTDHTLTM